MACKRNRIIDIIEYLNSCGIQVNVGKNKARGNKGFFSAKGVTYRIDIAKNLSEDVVLRTLAHEFAHFVHFKYDKTLKRLDFIFDNYSDEITEELISLTVKSIPKDTVKPIYEQKSSIEGEISKLENLLLKKNISKSKSEFYLNLENKIKKTDLKYLLKYDNVKIMQGFAIKRYTIDSLGYDSDTDIYLKLKSKQRLLKRINSKIARLNKYYNSTTELFARSFEMFLFEKEDFQRIAPRTFKYYENMMNTYSIPFMCNFVTICL